MIITYRDELGLVSVVADSQEIMFLDGEVYFDCGGEEYRIPVQNLVSISKFTEV